MKFKVLRGLHHERGVTYQAGQVVDSASDLSRHNSPGAVKFQPLDSGDDLGSMTKARLEEVAAEEGIDLEPSLRKSEIVKVIREARGE